MLTTPEHPVVATHWGTYRARMAQGRVVALDPHEIDGDPSPIAESMIGALDDPLRIAQPMVRADWLARGYRATGTGRGREEFVPVTWEVAQNLVANELSRVIDSHGNSAIYGGSYGWASAGRFHHAQSQIHRFLNVIGGYTRSVQNYSFAAASTILPHVVGTTKGLTDGHTSWSDIAKHSQTVVMFGGLPAKNAQVSAGGIGQHILARDLAATRDQDAHLVLVSPIRDDLDGTAGEWLAVRPGSDVALMMGLAHTLISENLHDVAFLARYTTGYERLGAYLDGTADGVIKDAEWASALCDIPAVTIRDLARRMAKTRTMLMLAWSLQRGDHGEQPCWMVIALAALLGQIGLPGGGFGIGYGSVNGIGEPVHDLAWPSLPQGHNPVADFIPVARVTDMLESPGLPYEFNGEACTYPDIRLVYWAGGNPFHHHQDLNRFVAAWRRPETVIVHESWWNATARHADIVLPVTTQLERNDIVFAKRDGFIAASHQVALPFGTALSDYDIFWSIADKMGFGSDFSEDRNEADWLRLFHAQASDRLANKGIALPDFESFWETGLFRVPPPDEARPLFAEFRVDPKGQPLATPSGKIEIASSRIAGFGYDDCPGHPVWLPPYEWLGAAAAREWSLHLVTNQPKERLHSQYDHGSVSKAAKVAGREPMRMNPQDAHQRGITDGDVVRVFNTRGACLAGAVLSEALRPGVVQMATGAWYDPSVPEEDGSLEKHGSVNVLTRDHGTSRLAQGPSPLSCLVEVERADGEFPDVSAFVPPRISPAE